MKFTVPYLLLVTVRLFTRKDSRDCLVRPCIKKFEIYQIFLLILAEVCINIDAQVGALLYE